MNYYDSFSTTPPMYHFGHKTTILRFILGFACVFIMLRFYWELISLPFRVIVGTFSGDALMLWFIAYAFVRSFVTIVATFLPKPKSYNLVLLQDRIVYWCPRTNVCKYVRRRCNVTVLFNKVILDDGENIMSFPRCGNVLKFLEDVVYKTK